MERGVGGGGRVYCDRSKRSVFSMYSAPISFKIKGVHNRSCNNIVNDIKK